MIRVPIKPERRSEMPSARNADDAGRNTGSVTVAMKNEIFLVSDKGSAILISPSAVIMSTFTYWNESGMTMHSNTNM